MPNLDWSKLNSQQLGRYAEYYALMEFASFGFEVYTSEVDDHGVDFIVKSKQHRFIEIQVKSLRATNSGNYTFIHKTKMDVDDENRIVCFIYFINERFPDVYLIPATAWKRPNKDLVGRYYIDKTSKPEWGICYSKRNRQLLERYKIENYIQKI